MKKHPRDAFAFLTKAIAMTAAEEHEQAQGYVLMATYPGDVSPTFYGLIFDPVEALRVAERFAAELNKGNVDEEPYVVKTYPVLAPPEYPMTEEKK